MPDDAGRAAGPPDPPLPEEDRGSGFSYPVPPAGLPAHGRLQGLDGVVHALHPATIFIEIFRFARAWALPLAAVLIAVSETDAQPWWFWPALVGAVMSLLHTVARFLSLRYGLEGGRLVIREGILFRRLRTIPLSRIQNIHLKSGVLHRLFRITDIRVETAGAGEADARLSAVGSDAAGVFRSEILARRGRESSAGVVEASEVLKRSSLRDILVAGATETRAGVIVAGLFGLFELFEDYGDRVKEPVRDLFHRTFGDGPAGSLIAAVTGVIMLVVAGWLLSIGWSLLTWFGFTLFRQAGDLRRQHGLLTRYEAAVPLARVQVLRLEANVLRRLLGLLTVRADTAGSAKDHEEAGTTMLCPLLRDHESAAFTRVVFPDLDLGALRLAKVHPRALRRGFVRLMLPGVALAGLAAAALGVWAWLGLVPWAALAGPLAAARYRALGWTSAGRFLVTRAGVWTRRLWIVPHAKIQSVAVARSPVQRWLGLATLLVDTAGASALSHVRILDVGGDVARRLLDDLSAASAADGAPRGGL